DAGGLARFMESTPINVLKITPSHIRALLAADDARVLPRRWLVLGGERASWDLIDRVRALSGCAILNHYGPTETTVGSCTFVVGESPGEYDPASVPNGSPIFNTSCYVLDDYCRLAPVGVPGKLFIAGAGVCHGDEGSLRRRCAAGRLLHCRWGAGPGAAASPSRRVAARVHAARGDRDRPRAAAHGEWQVRQARAARSRPRAGAERRIH